MSSINNNLYNKKPGNVFLHNNLYKQAQLAYAIPRVISLITVGNGSSSLSASFQLPLPQDIFSYKELKLQGSFIHATHTIFLFKTLNRQQIKPATATLAHIHNS